MLLISITFVLLNNLRLTFLCFPFWDSEIVLGALVTQGAAGEALDFSSVSLTSCPVCLFTFSRVLSA